MLGGMTPCFYEHLTRALSQTSLVKGIFQVSETQRFVVYLGHTLKCTLTLVSIQLEHGLATFSMSCAELRS